MSCSLSLPGLSWSHLYRATLNTEGAMLVLGLAGLTLSLIPWSGRGALCLKSLGCFSKHEGFPSLGHHGKTQPLMICTLQPKALHTGAIKQILLHTPDWVCWRQQPLPINQNPTSDIIKSLRGPTVLSLESFQRKKYFILCNVHKPFH